MKNTTLHVTLTPKLPAIRICGPASYDICRDAMREALNSQPEGSPIRFEIRDERGLPVINCRQVLARAARRRHDLAVDLTRSRRLLTWLTRVREVTEARIAELEREVA